MNYILSKSPAWSLVAEKNGKVVGSNFLWEDTRIAGIGPITIDPKEQNASAGRKLMEGALRRVEEKRLDGVRLVQAAYHNRSLSLYAKLGFEVKEPLSVIQGPPPVIHTAGYDVRLAKEDDLAACNEICNKVHGHSRSNELLGAIRNGTAHVVEYKGKISGYSSQLGYFGHTVTETNNDLKALICAVTSFSGPGFLLPSRNAEMLVWCLNNGLRIIQPMTLMTRGFYTEPAGAYLPSVLY
jgi:predicted N-acetyltransferase YhbS